jgi:AcrR family transcriptional regulator
VEVAISAESTDDRSDQLTPGGDQLTPGAQRILDVASKLFYRQGLHAVGVDTIAAESGVTKRTLYNRFGSKDGLIAAYLQARNHRWRESITSRLNADHADPVQRALVPFDVLPEWLALHTRGCSFINAFAELPEPDHPGHQVIIAEKKWLHALFRELLAKAGARDPDVLAVQLLSLHEGAIVCYAIVHETNAPKSARAAAEALIIQSVRHL